MATQEDCKMEETLKDDTSSVASLDMHPIFNSTNDNTLMKTVKAKSPITSKTSVKKRPMDKCGVTPGLMHGMWLDVMLMITITSFQNCLTNTESNVTIELENHFKCTPK